MKGPTKIAKTHIGRKLPATKQYNILKSIPLDIERFNDDSFDRNRNESELKEYLGKLFDYCRRKRHARPKRIDGDKLFKPLYNYDKTYSTDTDLRPSYKKFLDNIEDDNKELYNEIIEPLNPSEMIDMNYLKMYEHKDAPNVLNDDEYPEWLWELTPESRVYNWTDLIQTPFENLSEIEKHGLFRKWKKTLIVSNKMWIRSNLGKLGQVRMEYNDPWPKPITKMDIPKWINNDSSFIYDMSNIDNNGNKDDNEQTNMYIRPVLRPKKINKDVHLLNDGSNDDDIINDDINNETDIENELIFERINLETYYGMENENINIDDENIKNNVVYTIAKKSK